MNKEFYERLLLADVIASLNDKVSLVDVYRDFASKDDTKTSDYIWVNTVGNKAMGLDDAITEICFKVLEIEQPQPRYNIFKVNVDTLMSDENTKKFVVDFIDYLQDLFEKYRYIYEAKMQNYESRGKRGYLSYYEEWRDKILKYSETSSEIKSSSAFQN